MYSARRTQVFSMFWSSSLVAVLDLCPTEGKLLWAHALPLVLLYSGCSKVACDFMSKTSILHSDVLFYMLSVHLILREYSVCFNILSLVHSYVFQGLKTTCVTINALLKVFRKFFSLS